MPVFACALVTTTRIAGCRNTTLHQLTAVLLAPHVSILCLPPTTPITNTIHIQQGCSEYSGWCEHPTSTYTVIWRRRGLYRKEVLYNVWVWRQELTAWSGVFLKLFCYSAGLEFLRLYETKRQNNLRCVPVLSCSEISLAIRWSTWCHNPKDLKFHSLVQFTHTYKLESVVTWTSHLWLGLSNCLCL